MEKNVENAYKGYGVVVFDGEYKTPWVVAVFKDSHEAEAKMKGMLNNLQKRNFAVTAENSTSLIYKVFSHKGLMFKVGMIMMPVIG